MSNFRPGNIGRASKTGRREMQPGGRQASPTMPMLAGGRRRCQPLGNHHGRWPAAEPGPDPVHPPVIYLY